jgi:hypothetical protein
MLSPAFVYSTGLCCARKNVTNQRRIPVHMIHSFRTRICCIRECCALVGQYNKIVYLQFVLIKLLLQWAMLQYNMAASVVFGMQISSRFH